MSQKKYYIINQEKQETGPFTIEELKMQNITSDTPVWEYGPGTWKYARDIKELGFNNDTIFSQRKTVLVILSICVALVLVYMFK